MDTVNSIISTESTMETVHSFTLLHYMPLSTMLLWQFSLTCNKETYLSLHAKCPILNKLRFFWQIFHKRSKYQFLKIHFVGADLIHVGMTKLIGTSHEYVNMAKNTFIIIMNYSAPCTQHLIQYFLYWSSLITYLLLTYHRC